MNLTTLKKLTQGHDWVGLGIAGNQAEHLDQAGEAGDFLQVDAPDNAPKGIFPWYIPQNPGFLGVSPLSHDTLTHNGELRLQPEPEIALVLKLNYSSDSSHLLKSVSTLGFSVFNDCSRREQEPKISIKKNWGPASQGMSDQVLAIDDFSTPGGNIDHYRLTCHMERDGELLVYGKDTAVSDYCYFNATLEDWITEQINNQNDHGPLENIRELISPCSPQYAVVGIGATCYTEFGNSDERFLKTGDTIHITAYNASYHSAETIKRCILENTIPSGDSTILHLRQSVAPITSKSPHLV